MKKVALGLIGLISIFFIHSLVFAEEIGIPAEELYQKALMKLVDMGAIPSFRDKELLLIRTDPLPKKLTMEECDCGRAWGIPYIKDKRVKTALTYQVRIKKIDENKSDVYVKITVDGYMNVNESELAFFMPKTRDKNKVLTCKSKGILESKFIDSLKE